MSLTLYGVPLSQPFRACAWLMLLKGQPFKVQVTVPGDKNGTRSPEYLKLVPGGTIPALRDGEFVVSESNAIMQYLCDRNGWGDYYPRDLQARARIDQILHWHHSSVRQVTIHYLFPRFRPDAAKGVQSSPVVAKRALRVLDQGYLAEAKFLAGTDTPTIADIAAYAEIGQLSLGGIMDVAAEFPRLGEWMKRMEALPHHDAVFASITAIRHVLSDPEKKLAMNDFRNATSSGLKALKQSVAKL